VVAVSLGYSLFYLQAFDRRCEVNMIIIAGLNYHT
jgi:hypothetical protein